MNMMSTDSTLAEFAKQLALSAGAIVKAAFFHKKTIQRKESYADLVTETDKNVENFIREQLKENYPTHLMIGEESSPKNISLSCEPTWIVDPIDGTSNFASRFPFCCVCLGLYINREAAISAVYNPISDNLFFAEKGKGAYLNGERIHVSDCEQLSDALVLTDWGSDRIAANLDTKTQNLRSLITSVRGIRTMGSAALHMCQVAAGHGDIFFEFGIHCWDYAATSLIVTEAGGWCCNYDGSPVNLMGRNCVCAASKELANAICQRITPIFYPSD